jgi:esterase/lipase
MTTKAKRKLSDISFQHEGAHVALVSKQQGGPANGHDYALVMKATGFSQEFVTKMQQVRVTMELPEFLRKFFNVYYEDAEVLARMMGYVEVEDEVEDTDSYEDWYENRIQERLDQFEVLKSLNESKDIAADILALGEDKYLKVLKSQSKLEKVLAKIEKNSAKAAKAKAEEGSTEAVAQAKQSDETQTKVEPSENVNKGKNYMDELEEVKKASEATKAELAKALEQLNVFKAEKQEMIRKARFDKLLAAVKDEAKAESLFKALSLLESDAEFDASVEVLAGMQAIVEKSEMFKETGATVDVEDTPVAESQVSKVLKAKYAQK